MLLTDETNISNRYKMVSYFMLRCRTRRSEPPTPMYRGVQTTGKDSDPPSNGDASCEVIQSVGLLRRLLSRLRLFVFI